MCRQVSHTSRMTAPDGFTWCRVKRCDTTKSLHFFAFFLFIRRKPRENSVNYNYSTLTSLMDGAYITGGLLIVRQHKGPFCGAVRPESLAARFLIPITKSVTSPSVNPPEHGSPQPVPIVCRIIFLSLWLRTRVQQPAR